MRKLADLKIWEKSLDLAEKIYRVAATFPTTVRFNLISQIQRCAVSITSNIAEGAGRDSNKELHHFLTIAQGSLYELETQLILSVRIGILEKDMADSILAEIQELQKMVFAFKKSLAITSKKRLNS